MEQQPDAGESSSATVAESFSTTIGDSSDSAEQQAELHVVAACKTVAGDSVFTSWLGYPKSRNCWRSLTLHFPNCGTLSGSDLARVRTKLSVEVLTGDVMPLPVLEGRAPPAKDIRSSATSTRAASDPTWNRPEPKEAPAAKKARKRNEYETKVHTIRIDQTGVHEIRGVKRAGTIVPDVKVEAEGGSAGGAAGADGSAAATSSRIDPASSASGASGAGSGGTGGSGGVKSVADERSELWAAHRQVNEATWRSSTGFLFRAEVTDVSVDSNVTLRWTYPSSSPGAESAWVGLWDANEFDWVGGEPRPRYIRYKALTSTKQEGTLRFTTKEWKVLPRPLCPRLPRSFHPLPHPCTPCLLRAGPSRRRVHLLD